MNSTTLIDAAALARAVGRATCFVVDCRFDIGDSQRGAREYAFAHVRERCTPTSIAIFRSVEATSDVSVAGR